MIIDSARNCVRKKSNSFRGTIYYSGDGPYPIKILVI